MTETVATPRNAAIAPVLPLRRLRGWTPCKQVYRIIRTEYPQGVPLTRAAARRLAELEVPIYWGLGRLIPMKQRRDYARRLLDQGRDRVSALLEAVNEHAVARR